MKTAGLIGGMSWESTALYYKYINEGVKNTLGGLHSAKMLINSVDFGEVALLQSKGEWEKGAEMMIDEAQKLRRAGADFIMICTNTMHISADEVEESLDIPLLRITDAAAEAALSAGVKRAGLLGTAFTMERDFYRGRMEKLGLDVIVPDAADRKFVHDVIYNELCLGDFRDSSRNRFTEIIEKLGADGAQGVILGCTEIPLLVEQKDSPLRLFDTTRLHAEAAVRMMLG
ncbi:aspartate/glutamate racemase family protein [Geovibrio thiophilus]|uniref:Aspartate/glutamate racemase family protein n=1 Tax=Geovibrio thiophilus TaxID=139438 RepID=A0A410JVB8_9BACT|nr:aspartate/glutamate racemase family protein [Geovibrio thiophilus]QAR32157.1 aspartate/glutamate racemase family protein [Geovibrio thiophilus]